MKFVLSASDTVSTVSVYIEINICLYKKEIPKMPTVAVFCVLYYIFYSCYVPKLKLNYT